VLSLRNSKIKDMTQLTKKLMYLNHVITDYLAVKL